MNNYLQEKGEKAKKASFELAVLSTAKKNQCLLSIADTLTRQKDIIIAANNTDLAQAREKGMSEALLDRLKLDEKRLTGIISDVRKVVSLDDPVGSEIDTKILPNGLKLAKRRIPIGVLGVIYEARPNVTVDIVSLCIKTGNACILRGGSETINSNIALISAIHEGMRTAGVSEDVIAFYEAAFKAAMEDPEYIAAAEQAGMATDFKDAAATAELIAQQQTFAESLAEGFWYEEY